MVKLGIMVSESKMSTAEASKDSKIVKKDYFKGEKIILKIVGISFTGDESLAYRIYSFVVVLFFNVLYPLLDIRELFVNPIDVVVPMLMFVLYINVGMVKLMVVIRSRLKFGKLMERLHQKPFLPDFERGGDIEQKLIDECLWITQKQAIVYWTAILSTVTANFLHSFVLRLKTNDNRDWEFYYGPFTIFNATYSPNYEITVLYQNISLYRIAFGFCTTDLLIAGILVHVSYQFKILQNTFRRIVENSYMDMIKENNPSSSLNKDVITSSEFDVLNVPWKYLKKSLKDAVEYHLAIIDLANEMEEVFSDLLLVVALSSLTILALVVYHLTQVPLNDTEMVGTAGALFVNWLQIAVIFFWGNEVILESQRVGSAIYESNFVGTDLRFQKFLAFVIRRSQNPTKLTAGKFTDLCLFTFVWIMRASYSSFTLLRNTNKK